MSNKPWRMTVVKLGTDEVVHDARVEAENWMVALRKARAAVGESGGVPPGSSCAVAPDGRVTILDPIQRRRFVLETGAAAEAAPAPEATQTPQAAPQNAPAAAAPVQTPQAAPPNAPAAAAQTSQAAPRNAPAAEAPSSPLGGPSPSPAPKKKKKNLKQTMAYIPDTPAAPAAPPAKKRAVRKTMAYLPPAGELVPPASAPEQAPAAAPEAPASGSEAAAPEATPAPEPSAPAAVAAPGAAAPEASPEPAPAPEVPAPEAAAPEVPAAPPAEPAPPAEAAPPAFQVLHQRDEDPSEKSPLTYRERSYAVSPELSLDEAEAFIRARADALMKELAHVPQGRFLNLAVFDHAWTQKPARRPLVTLALKDWQGDAIVERFQPSIPPPAKRSSTDEHDRRLADAFEACQDLLFLATPFEGAEFVLKLLCDLIPSEAAAAALYDIDDNVHRIVVATGTGHEGRRGVAVPHDAGLFGAVSGTGSTLVFTAGDARFVAEYDGRDGLEIRDGLYAASVHEGRQLAVLQLLNRQGKNYSQADADLANYVAGQLAEFLKRARASRRPGA